MTSVLQFFQIVKESQDREKEKAQGGHSIKKPDRAPTKIQELSPNTLRRNLSNDNFIKFQWSWIL